MQRVLLCLICFTYHIFKLICVVQHIAVCLCHSLLTHSSVYGQMWVVSTVTWAPVRIVLWSAYHLWRCWLKQHTFIMALEVRNPKLHSFQKLCGENSLPSLLVAAIGYLCSLVYDLFLHLQSQKYSAFSSVCLSSSLSLLLLSHLLWLSCLPLFLTKTICGYAGSTQIIEDSTPI